MQIIHSPQDAYTYTFQQRLQRRRVGIVPTMGALHHGHLSLVEQSQRICDLTVATIFVNPTQFAAGEDLSKYPRTFAEDCQRLREAGVAAVFAPDREAMYPEGFSTFVQPPEVARSMEGAFRPEHFRGVTTVVLKLFQILPGTHAFFGQKDYQQLKVIEAMVRDLAVPIEIVPCPIVREADGLAMSSRNRYLNETDRGRALLLSAALDRVAAQVAAGTVDVEQLQTAMRQVLTGFDQEQPGVDKIDYAAIVDAQTLIPVTRIAQPAVALVAAHVGTTRLIDNRILA